MVIEGNDEMGFEPGNESAADAKVDPVQLIHRHAGLVVAGATSILVCLKILAVARWNSTTAFGILASSGNANVLTGTLLTVLPFIYGLLYVYLTPGMERLIGSPANKPFGALEWLRTLALILLIVIVPAILVAVILIGPFVVRIIRWRRSKNRETGKGKPTVGSLAGSATAGGLAQARRAVVSVLFVLYATLPAPWLPAELIKTESGEHAAFVLTRGNDNATVLVSQTRTLEQISVSALTGRYCEEGHGWFTEPIFSVFTKHRYPECP